MEIRPRRMIEWIEIIWRRKRVLFLMALAMLIATYAIIKRIPYIYESRALIVVTYLPPQGNDDPIAQGASFGSVMQVLTSRGNLAGLVRRYKLYPHVTSLDLAIVKLNKDIRLDVKNRGYHPDGPESASIIFRYPEAGVAQKVVMDLVSNFEQANSSIRQIATGELNTLNGKIVEVEDRLKQLGPERDIEVLRAQMMTSKSAENLTSRTQRLTVESTIETLSDKEYAAERQINDLKRQIEEQEKAVAGSSSNALPTNNPAYAALLVRKAQIDSQIKEYSAQYTEKNPKLIAVRGELAEINRQMARLEASTGSTTSSPEAVELKKMKLDLNRLQTDLEITRRDLVRKTKTLETLPSASGASDTGEAGIGSAAVAGGSAGSRSEYERLAARYTWLLGKQDQLMKLAGIAGSSAPMFQVVDSPFLPLVPVAPNKIMLLGLAVGMAIVFGLLIVLILELPKIFVLNSERDVEYYLGAPVLALIPETLPITERRRYRRLRWTRSLILLLFAAALIPALFVLIDRTQIFQVIGSR